jgi:hypothetical protein
MLEDSNPQCMDLLEELEGIPGTEALVQCIENFDFENAVLEIKKFKLML